MKITIKYFAALSECAGKTQEMRELSDTSVKNLYKSLQKEYHFKHDFTEVRVAINQSYVDESVKLSDGDEVVFITPVAGG